MFCDCTLVCSNKRVTSHLFLSSPQPGSPYLPFYMNTRFLWCFLCWFWDWKLFCGHKTSQRASYQRESWRRERAVTVAMLIAVLSASCAEAAPLAHDADSLSLRAKVTELTQSDIHIVTPTTSCNRVTGTSSDKRRAFVRAAQYWGRRKLSGWGAILFSGLVLIGSDVLHFQVMSEMCKTVIKSVTQKKLCLISRAGGSFTPLSPRVTPSALLRRCRADLPLHSIWSG